MRDADGGVCESVGGSSMQEVSVLSIQFVMNSKLLLKKSTKNKKGTPCTRKINPTTKYILRSWTLRKKKDSLEYPNKKIKLL